MPRNSLTEDEVQAMRQRLCSAALSLYKAQGIGAVSFRSLANRTGTSHTQPYRYFANKEELFAAVRIDCYQRFASVIRDNDPPGASPAARLQAIHDAIMQFVQAEPAEYQLMFAMPQPALQEHPELLSVRREAFDYLVDIVQQAVDQQLLDADARTLMHIAWGAVHGLLSLHTAGQLVHGRDLHELTQPLLRRIFAPMFDSPTSGAQQRRMLEGKNS